MSTTSLLIATDIAERKQMSKWMVLGCTILILGLMIYIWYDLFYQSNKAVFGCLIAVSLLVGQLITVIHNSILNTV